MRISLIAGAVVLALSLPAAAQQRLALMAPEAGDLVPTSLSAAKVAMPQGVETQPVSFAWALDAYAAIEAPQPHLAESREFYTELDAKALSEGWRFHASGPGAVIRISPLAGEQGKSAVAIDDVMLRRGGQPLSADALQFGADAEALKAAGANFGEGTVAFRIDPALGAGAFEIGLKSAAGRYLVHVFEPASPYRATLQTARGTVHAGGTLQAEFALFDGEVGMKAGTLGGALHAPDGRVFDVAFDADGHARIALPKLASSAPGLWELHAFAVADGLDGPLLRDVKTAFAVSEPNARLGDQVQVASKAGGLAFEVPVQVAGSGRFELRALLYGTDATGTLRPMAAGHAAAMLDANGSITLEFPANTLKAGFGAPYELRQLRLADQGRLAVLETRGRAGVLEALPEELRRSDAVR